MKKKRITAKHSEDELGEIPKLGPGFFANAIKVGTPEELWEATGAGIPKQ